MNLNRPDMTEDVKSKDYTNKFLQTGSNPVTMEASGIVVPCEFSVRNLKRFLTKLRTIPLPQNLLTRPKQPRTMPLFTADGRGTISVSKIMQRANKDALEKLDPNQVYHTFPDRREGSKSSLILKKPKTKKSNRVLYMTKPLKEELLAWLEKLKQDEQNAPEKYSNCGQLFRLPDGLPIAPESKQPAATKITGKEILEAIRLMDAEERRELTRALFAYLFFFLCKGKQAVQAMRRKAPDSGKCANGVQKVCSHFPT